MRSIKVTGIKVQLQQTWIFPSTVIPPFCVPNWVCKWPKAFSHPKESGRWSTKHFKPPIGPGQSPGWGPRSKAPGSSAYLGFENLLLQLKISHLLLIISQFMNYIAHQGWFLPLYTFFLGQIDCNKERNF